MSRKKKRNTRRPGPAIPPGHVRVAGPRSRMKPMLDLLDEVTRAGDRDAGLFGPISPGEEQFDFAIMNRGINILKAVSLLAENGHWEMAAAPNRQLFELLLNLEEINRQPDRGAALEKYRLFGEFQFLRARREELRYNEETGRTVDADDKGKLDAIFASDVFDVFKGKPRADGTRPWVTHWNRTNAREMAEASDQPIRASQYFMLFSRWSEEAHSTPGALFGAMNRTVESGWIERVIANDDVRTAEIVSMAIPLFIELRQRLPKAPALSPEESAAWIERLHAWTVARFEPA